MINLIGMAIGMAIEITALSVIVACIGISIYQISKM